MCTSVCPVHALRNIDSNKGGKACPSFPPRGGTRAPGRGAESRGSGSRVGLHACTRHWRGRHHTADWLGPDPDGPRAAVGLTKESACPSRAAVAAAEVRARGVLLSPSMTKTYRAVYFWGGDASHSLPRRDDAWHSRRHDERIFRSPRAVNDGSPALLPFPSACPRTLVCHRRIRSLLFSRCSSARISNSQ